MTEDTIAAVVTAMGASSVGIIRLSGAEAVPLAQKIYRGKSDFAQAMSHTIHYGKVYDAQHDKIVDEALFMLMKGPRSFTGEDVVEIQCHGGAVVMEQILQLVLGMGARLAEPGEYSKRAFLNGKMDLIQAEAIMDIVNAKTEKGLDVALGQLQGKLSVQIKDLRSVLLEMIAFIQADIDYPDDDIERLSPREQQARAVAMQATVGTILAGAKKGQIIRDGLQVVIAGKPNVGKSSLLNALLGHDRAIVTDLPGTTRDVIEEYANLRGIPLKFVDTAGIRDTDNLVEQLGVEKARQFLQSADLVLYVFEATEGLTAEDEGIIALIERPLIFLHNKMDLPTPQVVAAQNKRIIGERPWVEISARDGQGLAQLEEAIMALFFAGDLAVGQEVLMTNVRHIAVLQEVAAHLQSVIDGIDQEITTDFLVIDLQSAWEKLGTITGDTVEDDLLDQIFANFCLGK